ncbi:MAG: hypothetical protein P4L92_00105 [Rudaea sp.]|nr:hypothetical protein [Rudaea sp.]
MKPDLHNETVSEPTRKEFWLTCFQAALHRVSPEKALKEADRALALSDKRWLDAEYVATWHYTHHYPVGHKFLGKPLRSNLIDYGALPIKPARQHKKR